MSESLLIAAHGSRDPAGLGEFWAFAEAWQRLRADRMQAAGFLEFARPTIGEAVDDLAARGTRRIVVAPAMLMAAGHVKNDVPSEIHQARQRHPEIAFHMARSLDLHPALLELCQTRYREALEGLAPVDPTRTVLLLVGRGTSDPDANANIARISRFLWEAYGVGWATVAYAGLAAPSVADALKVCRRMALDRIVIQPYLLFDGVLLKRIHQQAARLRDSEPHLEVICTQHLQNHPLLLRAFEDRAYEAIHGAPPSTCDLCKYRVRVVGHELDLGQPQEGHHHHARAQAAGDGHDHRPWRERSQRHAADAASAESHVWDPRLLEQLNLAR